MGWFVWWVGYVVYFNGTTYDAPETGDGYLLLSIANLLLRAAAALIGVVVFVVGKRFRSRTNEVVRVSKNPSLLRCAENSLADSQGDRKSVCAGQGCSESTAAYGR